MNDMHTTDLITQNIDLGPTPSQVGSVQVISCPHPFSTVRIDRTVLEGLTIRGIVDALALRGEHLHARVFIDDRLVPHAEWERARPVAGQLVTVRVIPTGGGGGGKDILRMVAMIAVIAVAAWVTAGGASAFLPEALAMGLGAGTTAASVAGGLVAIGGMLAVNALIPPPGPKFTALSGGAASAGTSPTLSLTGVRNQFAPYGVIPQVLGTHRIFPPLAARPYTEIVGTDQYLHCLFTFGYGPLVLEDFKIGETALSEFDGVELIVLDNYNGTDPIPLFPVDVFEDGLSIALTQASGWHTRTSQLGATELSVDLAFTGGLVEFGPTGALLPRTVALDIEYRLVGAGSWTNALQASTAAAKTTAHGGNRDLAFTAVTPGYAGNNLVIEYHTVSWYAPGTIQITFLDTANTRIACYMASDVTAAALRTALNTTASAVISTALAGGSDGSGLLSGLSGTSARLAGGVDATDAHVFTDNRATLLRFNRRWHVPAGQYEVRVQRVTADSAASTVRDQVYWTMLRTIQTGLPVRKQGVTLAVVRIKATDQLNGTLDEFNAIAKTVCLDWDGTGWLLRPTNNPAALFRHVLQGRANARPIVIDRIDLPTLQAWHGRCVAGGRTYNAVRDFTSTLYETLRDVAAIGRASYTLRDGQHSVVEDLPQATPVQIFSPRNSWGFRSTKLLTTVPHALRCRFVNVAKGYIQDVRPVYDDGYNADGTGGLTPATLFEELDLPGCDNPDLAYRLGRYHIAVAKLRPEMARLTTDVENLVCTRGDRIEVAHDVPMLALGQARITAVTLNSSGSITALTLDDPIVMTSGQAYGIRIRQSDGTQVVASLLTVDGSQTAITPATPIAVTRPAARDDSGSDLDGTYQGTPRLGVAGLLDVDPGTAVSFNGPNGDHLTVGDLNTAVLDIQPAMSIEFVISMPSFALDAATTQRVCGKSLNSNNRWTVNIDQNGGAGINLMYLGVSYSAAANTAAGRMAINTRTHIVITFATATPIVYVNGVAVSAGVNGAGMIANGAFTVGRLSATNGRFTGTLAHLAKYNTVLSPARVAAHAAAVLAGGYPEAVRADNPVLYLQMGESQTPDVGDLLTFGLAGQESESFLVKAIEPGPDLTAQLTLVDYALGVQTADTEAIPPYESNITLPAVDSALLPQPIVTQVVSDESVLVRAIDGSLESRIVLTLQFASGVRLQARSVQVQVRPTGSTGAWTDQFAVLETTQDIVITGVQDGMTYDIRLRAEHAGAVSDWTVISGHTVIGKTTPPATVLGFTATMLDFAVQLRWQANTELDLAGYEIRRGAIWETATVVTHVSATSYVDDSLVTGSYTYLIKAMDVAGNLSAAAAAALLTVTAPLAANPTAQFDGQDLVLAWTANQGSLPIAEYEIRHGATFAGATVVQRVTATGYRQRVEWLGARTWWVVGIDVAGNLGTESGTTATVTPPATSTITPLVIDNTVLLRWTAEQGTLPIQNYEIRRGSVFGSADVLGSADTTFDVIIETLKGSKTYWIVPRDVAGNLGVELSVTAAVDSPPDFILRDSFLSDFYDDRTNVQRMDPDRVSLTFDGVDDYVIINPFSQMPATTLTAEFKVKSTGSGDGMVSYAVSGQANEFLVIAQNAISICIKGTQANTGIAVNDGEFHDVAVRWRSSDGTVQLVVDGTQRYSTTGIQTGASLTNGGSLVFGQDQDSVGGGFTTAEAFDGELDELRIWNEFRSDVNIAANDHKELIGTETNLRGYWRLNERDGDVANDLSNADLDGDIVGALWHVPTSSAIAPFFTAETVQDKQTVHGYTTPQAQIDAGFPYVAQPVPTTATLTAYYDAGLVLPATRIIVTPTEAIIAAGSTLSVQISVRETTAAAWTALTAGLEGIAATFRYVRVVLSWTSDGTGFARYDALETILRVKLKNDAGTVTVTANPTAVLFNEDFLDVESIVATPQGTADRRVVVDFIDVVNPTGFNLYLFNSAGAAVTGPVAWQARGA